MSKKNEELFGAYVSENESSNAMEPEQNPIQNNIPMATIEPMNQPQSEPAPIISKGETEAEILKRERSSFDGRYVDNLGYLRIDIKTLPTQGMFYPVDAELRIRAARGEEIKHWSTMNDQDLEQYEHVDELLNYILEKCVNLKSPSVPGYSWKDIKDIDRFYILLAVREFTFLDGDNELRIPISEGKELPIVKEMVDFVKIPDELLKYYSATDRCFVFSLPSGRTLRMHIPSIGSGIWLKNYAQQKRTTREQFDMDFYQFAPMLIGDYRTLSQRAYESMVEDSRGWTVKEWSLVSYVRDKIIETTNPMYKYINDNGEEVKIPLTFRGGIKAIFSIQNPLSILC